jgi:hypothetical protein
VKMRFAYPEWLRRFVRPAKNIVVSLFLLSGRVACARCGIVHDLTFDAHVYSVH